jgi:histone deacetylase 6
MIEKTFGTETGIVARSHPERPDRLKCVYEHLRVAGLLEDVVEVAGREAADDEIVQAHRQKHCDHICHECSGQRRQIDSDTYMCEDSTTAARLAVGTTIDVVEAVVEGRAASGMALVRPPGHHAEEDRAFGFCLFNNVACAARVAQSRLGVGRVLIFDWDVHHGNGTENIFYNDPSVLFISLHVHTDGFFPDSGPAERTGSGDGAGYNVNIAWPSMGMGDPEYLHAMYHVVMPVAAAFNPDLVLVRHVPSVSQKCARKCFHSRSIELKI